MKFKVLYITYADDGAPQTIEEIVEADNGRVKNGFLECYNQINEPNGRWDYNSIVAIFGSGHLIKAIPIEGATYGD